jgi:hypothetical protein
MKKNKLILAALLMASSGYLQAQVDLQNTGTLFITGGTDILYINGAFTNASGAALTNNGNLYVRQNLINNQSSVAIGTGTLYLNGSGAQSVSGTQQFRTFNFVSNNASGITLNSDLSVSGTHTFTAGIIASSATPNYLIYEAGSSYTGDGDGQHVSGWVRKTGTTAFTFPLGNGTVERTIGLTNLSSASTFNANYAGATTNTSNLASPLITVDANEYWNINQVSGGNAQVAMNWNNSKVAFPAYVVADIRVANYIAGNWTSVGGSASGNIATTGTISSSAVGVFGAFTFGSVSAVLPVQLLDFGVTRKNGSNLVTWSTADEINVKQYDVQRSDNGNDFYTAGIVAARNRTQVQQYQFVDNAAMKDVAYYRLRSIDNDGKFKTSKVVTVYDKTVAGSYFTLTNPVHTALTLAAGSNHTGVYDYSITAINGQVMQQGHLTMISGGNYNISLQSTIVPGMYIFKARSASFSYSQKILVQ